MHAGFSKPAGRAPCPGQKAVGGVFGSGRLRGRSTLEERDNPLFAISPGFRKRPLQIAHEIGGWRGTAPGIQDPALLLVPKTLPGRCQAPGMRQREVADRRHPGLITPGREEERTGGAGLT